ncbi:hypothetical protein L2D08_19035 [Domibacillus sp. PGB-M46]|nr:hypothetical protein [Domibacillus sp. PGB-M46]
MFHKDYRYEETKVTTVVKGIEFEIIGKIELEKGWKNPFSHQKEGEGEKTASNNVLPSIFKD